MAKRKEKNKIPPSGPLISPRSYKTPHSPLINFELTTFTNTHIGLSKDPPELTHPSPPIEPGPPLTEPTALAVGEGFHSPKPEINGSEIGSLPLKSEKPDPTYPSFSW